MQPDLKRLEYLDACRGIGILFILFGHIMNERNAFTTYISTYKITIFYIIVGILINHRKKTKFDIYKRCISIIKPYIIFSLLVIIFNFSVNFFIKHSDNSLRFFVRDMVMTVSFRGTSTLWFLPALFFGEYIFYRSFTSVVIRSCVFCSPVFALIVSGFYKFDDTIFSFFYMVALKSLIVSWFISIGYYGYGLWKKINVFNTKKIVILGIVLTMVNYVLSQKNINVDFNYLKYGDEPYMFFINGAIGAWGIILLMYSLYNKKNKVGVITIVEYFGKNSLIVMLTHLPFRLVSVTLLISNFIVDNYYLKCIVAFFLILLIEYFLIEVINKFFPGIIGKNVKNTKYVL